MLKQPWDVAASARRTGKRPARLRVSGAGRVNSVPECLRCQLPSTAAIAATVNGAFLLRMRTSGGLVQHLARLTITAATAAALTIAPVRWLVAGRPGTRRTWRYW
jgi:hypothetical protein